MAVNILSDSSSVTYDSINNTIYAGVRARETQLRDTLSKLQTDADGAVSQADMLRLQQEVTQWTLMIDIQSTMTKQVSDSLKGVIQKAT